MNYINEQFSGILSSNLISNLIGSKNIILNENIQKYIYADLLVLRSMSYKTV